MLEFSSQAASFISPVADNLFTSRNDPHDRRWGDIIAQNVQEFHDDAHITIALLGVPQDIGVKLNKGRIGAAAAPDAIRAALYKLVPFAENTCLDTENLRIVDVGNIHCEHLQLQQIHQRQQQIVACLLANGIIPIVMGGGHDIAYPDVAAFAAKRASAIINLDAHPDVRPLLQGNQAHSGSPFRQMLDDNSTKIRGENFFEFGIQNFAAAKSHIRYLQAHNVEILWYRQVQMLGFPEALRDIYAKIAAKDLPLMVSFDMDCVRAADAPGVSAPNPLGFTAEQVCQAAYFFGKSSLVGMIDIAEVNPHYDIDSRTAKLAALIIANFITGIAERKA